MLRIIRRFVVASDNKKRVLIQPSPLLHKSVHFNVVTSSGVTTPVLVTKSKKLGTALTAASLLAAPFTGGASLAAGAAARGAMVGVQGARAGLAASRAKKAGKALDAAKGTQTAALANAPSKVVTRRGTGVNTQAARRKTAADVGGGKQAQLPGMETVDPTDVGGGRAKGFEALQERTQDAPDSTVELPQDTDMSDPTGYQETFSMTNKPPGTMETRMQLEDAQAQSNEVKQKLQDAQDKYEESQKTNTPIGVASAAGAYGFNQMEQLKQKRQAQQKAEMERIEGLAEDARAKASTGTGGKVAVA